MDNITKNFFEILNSKLEKKITESDYVIVKEQIEKLLKVQGLSFEDIEIFESGQTFSALGIGDAVLKIGKDMKCVKNPYQLLPFHQEDLSDSGQKLYLSQRANTKDISREKAQRLYNLVREIY